MAELAALARVSRRSSDAEDSCDEDTTGEHRQQTLKNTCALLCIPLSLAFFFQYFKGNNSAAILDLLSRNPALDPALNPSLTPTVITPTKKTKPQNDSHPL